MNNEYTPGMFIFDLTIGSFIIIIFMAFNVERFLHAYKVVKKFLEEGKGNDKDNQ